MGPLQGMLAAMGKKSRLECDKCSETFVSRRVFVSHMNHHRLLAKAEQRPHECKVCAKTFLNPTSLDVHSRIIHGSSNTDKSDSTDGGGGGGGGYLDCEFCGKKCASKKNLIEHKATHSDEKSKYMKKGFLLDTYLQAFFWGPLF